ncbi:MAG: hypothetical protein HXS46_07130 [Theionarchaea archaeon]|nr:MAG: hypothetical protein AYK18_14480 [Theionarchaea archaeon DG-70]MBU7010447.1 hypothetical protein [Theionarchaea archaeon]
MDLIGILPTGKVWGYILTDLIVDTRNAFKKVGKSVSLDILTERPYPIPRLAFDVNLGKHRVEGFFVEALDIKTEVERMHDISIDRMLVLTDVDLCNPPDNKDGFGYADTHLLFAIVSIYRLQKGADRLTLKERLVKESLHELGHTYGLDHCPDSSCPMYCSKSVQEIDQKSAEFCPHCADMLSDSGYGEYWGV